MAFRIQIRRDSSINWEINNPVLLQGEFGLETDTDFLKVGDGQTEWNSLPYIIQGSGSLEVLNTSGQIVVGGATGIQFTGNATITSSGQLAIVNISGGPTGSPGPAGSTGAPGATGPSVNVLYLGNQIVGGATGIDFTGGGVSVTNSGNKAIVNITGGTASNTSPTYVLKVKFTSGSIDSIAPFPAAKGPMGNNLIGASGWNFVRNSINELTITHPANNLAVNIMTHAENSSGTYISRSITGTTTGNSANQLSTLDTINIKGLSGTFTGINTGGGPFYMYITWQFPSNNILI
jgi:hypothetical protein